MPARDRLERLWSPWRMAYVRGAGKSPAGGCLFCRVVRSRSDRAHLVLTRRRHALLMLNRFPYNPAHLMVALSRHAPRFGDLDAAEQADWMALTALAERALAAEYRPDGMNLGVNLGRVAGAGFPGHLHLHVVPRWNGDTNFMPTVAATRVLPESLGRTWARLRRAIRSIGDGVGDRERAPRGPAKRGAVRRRAGRRAGR